MQLSAREKRIAHVVYVLYCDALLSKMTGLKVIEQYSSLTSYRYLFTTRQTPGEMGVRGRIACSRDRIAVQHSKLFQQSSDVIRL